MEEFGSFSSVGCGEGFHLREDIKELCGWEGIECSGDGIGAIEIGWEVDADGELWDGGVLVLGRRNWHAVGRHWWWLIRHCS